MDVLRVNAIPLDAYWFNRTAWTVGGGDSTSLSVMVGDAGNADEVMAATALVGAAAPAWLQTAGAGATSRGTHVLEAAAYAPQVLFTAAGGTPDTSDADAGEGVAVLFYRTLPAGEQLWAWNQ